MRGAMLLNYTKKKNWDLKDFFNDLDLLCIPFDRLVSRLNYKTEHFHFRAMAESIEYLRGADIPQLSWEECCLRRADEILRLNRERYFIAYSGGIDSTTALVSLLRAWPKAEQKKISIFLTHNSIEENPRFFKKYITSFEIFNFFQEPSQRVLAEKAMLIMGELGDQLFGSDLLALGCGAFGDISLRGNYKIYVPKILELYLGRRSVAAKIFDRLQPIADEAPFPIHNTHDFLWWYNFTQKWQHVKFRFLELTDWDLRAQYDSHVLNFFDTPYFQKWSLENHDRKIRDTWGSYKFEAKDFIFNFTKDPEDLNLMKVQSLKNSYIFNRKRIAVADGYRSVDTLGDLREYVIK
jgi:hypothetical protein